MEMDDPKVQGRCSDDELARKENCEGLFVSYPLNFRPIISKRILSFRSIK
jgi:hypothetical protein